MLDETQRIASLHALRILDTAPEPAFDRLTALAADMFDAPMALVTLIDAERQWFKSRYGVAATETPRAVSFCAHVVERGSYSAFVLDDASTDPRFAANPFVTSEPGIRFYAGSPLIAADGAILGTICVLDTKPRARPSAKDLERLCRLAQIVVGEFELRRTNAIACEQRRLLELAEAMAHVGTWRYEPASGAVTWSDEVYRIHGVTKAFDPNLDDALASYHPDDRPKVEAHLRAALANKEGYQFQLRLFRPDGRMRDVICKASCELDERGEVAALIGVFQDITESVDQFRAVQRSEARYRLLADNMADALIRIRLDGTSPYVSPAIARIVGYTPKELAGHGIMTFIHPDDRGMVADAFRGLTADAPQCAVKHRYIHKNGQTVWIETSMRRIEGRGDRPAEIVGVIRDVNERRKLTVALQQSEARYRELAEKSSDIVVRVGRDGLVRYVSPACRSLGYEPDELTGRSILSLVAPGSIAYAQWTIDGLFTGDEPDRTVRREHKTISRDGRELWFEGNPTLVRDEKGEVIEYISSFRDITARKALEAELLEARRAAEEAAAVKSEFLANMSHELRTPMTAMLGFSRLVHEQPELSEQTRDYAGRVLVAGDALLTTVNDILDFSRLEAGQVVIRPQPTSVAAIVRESVDLFEDAARQKKLRLSFECDGAGPPNVVLDPGRLRQILLNFVGNAVKFTEQGSVAVRTAYDAASGRLTVRVQDTGPGIPADHAGRLFQRFSQVDGSSTRRHGGTGLGLAICKGLVDAMAGTIGVETTEGAGSTFWFEVPAPAAAQPGHPASGPDPAPVLVPGTRVLLAEDSPVNRKLVHALLEPIGFQIADAHNGAEAVRLAAEAPYDLILMDLRMPVLDGKGAALQIRAGDGLNAATAMLAFSADSFPDLGTGLFDGIITKPITPLTLRRGIADALNPQAEAVSDVAA